MCRKSQEIEVSKAIRNRTDRKTYRRMTVAFCIFAAMGVLIVGRLAKYQLKDYDYYQSQVLSQLTTETSVNPERGDIVDRNGDILATNKSVYNIIISPHHIVKKNEEIKKNNSDDRDDNDVSYNWRSEDGEVSYSGTDVSTLIATFLSHTLDVDYSLITEKMAKTSRQYEVIKNNVDETSNQAVREFIAEFDLADQIYDRESSKRYYPYGSLAAHVLGFTNSEGVGRDGLEAYYNNILEGKSGKYVLAHDATNYDMPFQFETYISEENG